MRKFIAAFILIAGMYSLAQADMYAFCNKKWGEKYKMRDQCIEKQKVAEEWVENKVEDLDMLKYCENEWARYNETDFEGVRNCIEKQQGAKNYIDTWTGDGGVFARCTKRWTKQGYPDYETIKSCIDYQQKLIDQEKPN